MKLDLSKVDLTDFNMFDCEFSGDAAVWIYPKLEGVKWLKTNLIQRSSIWRKSDGELISPGLKKFFNWAQEPDLYPPPDALSTKVKVVEKLDGSCLVISKYKGEFIIRIRRALASSMLNGDEIELFKKKYAEIFKWEGFERDESARSPEGPYSLIFEWVTPSNKIVLSYTEPDIKLIGCVNHENYSYVGQWQLDALARIWKIGRPKYFEYDTIQDMINNVSALKGEEGVCVYYANDQHIRKIKSLDYLMKHRFKAGLTIETVLDLYLEQQEPAYQAFIEEVTKLYDYECGQMAKSFISTVCDAKVKVDQIIAGMLRFVNSLKTLSRKDAAELIIQSYGNTNRASFVFSLLDGKTLDKKQRKKIYFQIMKHKI